MKQIILLAFLFFPFTTGLYSQHALAGKLSGPYLGQKTPGPLPEVFAPGIVSTLRNEHCPPAFSPEND